MKIFKSIIETQNYIKSNSVGFVPTMGALHRGHISLIERAKKENELVVCSIFVNPTQFNNKEDLEKYPRSFEKDAKMLEDAGCDILFAPSVEEMYPSAVTLSINFGDLENKLEGAFRPGHFNGVGIVVSKLFHIVKPNKAYFGLKDLQQCAVINSLVQNLSFGIDLVFCDTVREVDGLAMSSRNTRLSSQARNSAPFIYKSLNAAKELLLEGQQPEDVKRSISAYYETEFEFKLEYFEIVDFDTLNSIQTYNPKTKTAIVVAAHLGGVRLIDNIVF